MHQQRESVEGAAGNIYKGSQAMKNQLVAKLAAEIEAQIKVKVDGGQLSDSEESELCTAYQLISSQSSAVCS